MAFSVVCISAVDGARGEEVVPAVASALGFRVVDEEIVRTAAQEAGVDASQVAEVEKRRSMAIRLLDSLGTNTSLATFAMAGYVPGHEVPVESDLRGLIRTTIEEMAQRGNAVIVAHAASMALGDRSDVLKVMITASRSAREQTLAEQRGLDEKAAAKQVDKGDANRAAYLKRFYGITHESPADYDLVLNTDRLGPDGAAKLVVQAAA
jgi:Cytidylate kinase-like family